MDLDRILADTPAAARQVFLDSAGSSLSPTPVLDTVIGHLRREAEVGGYRAAAERADDLAAVRTSLGTLLGAPVGTLALTDSATRAWTQYFYAVPLRPGDRILLSGVEYGSNAIAALQRAEQTGARVEVVPSDADGLIDLEALARLLDDRVRLVSVVHVPTNGGLVNPVREVADLTHAHGAPVLLDACQSAGQLRLDVTELGVDALSGTGRKWLRGPRGTGFLYVREPGRLTPPVLDFHGAAWTAPDAYTLAPDATRFELFEHSVAARLGLGAAVDYALALGMDELEKAVAAGAQRLRDALAELPGVTVRDRGRQQCGLVTFTVEGRDPAAVRDALARQDITVTVSPRAGTLLDMDARGLDAVVRASPHYFVTPEQLDRAARAVSALTP
ncbi:MAG TPA: aminotransferase class V-fold PLP-dependent enzyme [Mycobacteriales bacterium]|nr:aminotransferase class V-fold PLP-dependent enzyme [Mycobacteriales bacterium]